MNGRRKTIFLSAAEASGDAHAAGLIEALRRRMGDVRFVGAAGPKMAAAGCEVLVDLTKHASMLGGPLLRVGYYVRQIHKLKKAIRLIRPDVHIPVDSPALNWHLASAAKKAGASVVHYIAPQVWAWAPWRVKKLARLTDHVACILPFEEQYLRDRGVPATFVGHPLFDTLSASPTENQMPDLLDAWAEGSWRVALLPGSRASEIRNHAPALLETARAIRRVWPESRFTMTAHSDEIAETLRKLYHDDSVEIAACRTREVLAESHFAIAASGTVTLEVAHFGVPMIVFYKASLFMRMLKATLGWWLLATRRFSLINVLAERSTVPELMPWRGNVNALTDLAEEVMDDLGGLVEMRRRLLKLVQPLRAAPRMACDNAAQIVCDVMEKRSPTFQAHV